jgi:hypothetical protein
MGACCSKSEDIVIHPDVGDPAAPMLNSKTKISQWEERSRSGFQSTSSVRKSSDPELPKPKKLDPSLVAIAAANLPTPSPKASVSKTTPVAPSPKAAPKRKNSGEKPQQKKTPAFFGDVGSPPATDKPLSSSRRGSLVAAQEKNQASQEMDIQAEMERIRQAKIKQYRETQVVAPEVAEKKQEEEQKQLQEKQDEAKKHEELLEKKRQEENRKQAERERINEEKRQKEVELLRKKVESGKTLSAYEKMLAEKLIGLPASSDGPPNLEASDSSSVHSSTFTERPQVGRLTDNEALGKSIAITAGVLDKVMMQQTGGSSLSDLGNDGESTESLNLPSGEGLGLTIAPPSPRSAGGGVTPRGARTPVIVFKDIDSLIQEMKFEDSTLFQFNNMKFFFQFPLKSAEREKNSMSFADIISNRSGLQKVECYNSGLDDAFLEQLSKHIKDGKFPDLKEIHLENNLFTGAGLEALMQAVSNQNVVPCLKTIKVVNQKENSTAAEQAAIETLKSNPNITKLAMDFRRDMDIANLNQLLAKNARHRRKSVNN